jgi:hypothetical protein
MHGVDLPRTVFLCTLTTLLALEARADPPESNSPQVDDATRIGPPGTPDLAWRSGLGSAIYLEGTPRLAAPLAVELHEARFLQGKRFKELFAAQTTGPRASVLFRQSVASAEVWYRLQDRTGASVPVSSVRIEEWKDATLLAGGLAAEALIYESLSRSDGLQTGWNLVRFPFSPSLTLARSGEGWRTSVNKERLGPRTRMRQKEAEQGWTEVSGRGPRVATGYGFAWFEEEMDGTSVIRVRPEAWFRVERLAFDLLQVSTNPVHGNWSFVARERLPRGASVSLLLSSQPEDATPSRWSAGLALPLPGLRSWRVLARHGRTLPIPVGRPMNWQSLLLLEASTPGRLPWTPGGWPMGGRLHEEGPECLWADAGAPNRLEQRFLAPLPPSLTRIGGHDETGSEP